MDHIYLVCYDISDPRRWRKVYRTLKGFGSWLQLSVFQCRLNEKQLSKMRDKLVAMLDSTEDHLMIIDVGPVDHVAIRVESMGRPFVPIKREAVIV